MSKDEHGRPRRHFNDYDPDENCTAYHGDNPLGHYDDHDVDHAAMNNRFGLGPYRPLHPWREAATLGLVILGLCWVAWWVVSKLFFF